MQITSGNIITVAPRQNICYNFQNDNGEEAYMKTKVIFSFDTEDFTSNESANAIYTEAEILREEGVRGLFLSGRSAGTAAGNLGKNRCAGGLVTPRD